MRLIDADELNKAMFHGVAEIVPEDEHSPESYKRGWNDALEAVADKSCTPTIDAVPVVQCKDCDWWDRIDDGSYGYCHSCKHGFYSANWEISIYRRYKEDFFCADGERRADADE